MPLPQPNLDDRTYQQLVEEAISAIPQLAPRWTDHNAHDPGITLIELFAWLAEMQQYYLNRDRGESVLKFLKLLGSPPSPAKPAQCQLSFKNIGRKPVFVPRGTPLGAGRIGFETHQPLLVLDGQVSKVLSTFAEGVQDYSEANKASGLSFPAFGEAARPGSRLYLGFQERFPRQKPIRLTFELFEEYPVRRNPDPAPPDELLPQAGLDWEFSSSSGWSPLDIEEDTTRQLSRSGALAFQSAAQNGPQPEERRISPFPEKIFWLRATVIQSGYEVAPRIHRVLLNTVTTVQQETWSEVAEFSSSQGKTLFQAGSYLALYGQQRVQILEKEGLWRDWTEAKSPDQSRPQDRHYRLNASERTLSLAFSDGLAGLSPPAPQDLGLSPQSKNIRLISMLPGRQEQLELGASNGFPSQRLTLPLPEAELQNVRLQVAVEGGENPLWSDWQQVADFDSSNRFDRHFQLDQAKGQLVFGDGKRGAVPPVVPGLESSIRLVGYQVSLGSQGNLPEGAIDTLPPQLISLEVSSSLWSVGGSDAEALEAAGKRARRELKQPWRGVTSRDYESLALGTPGLRVARAIALPLQAPDPQSLGLKPAPATVTVVVAPFSLAPRPIPSPNFLKAVKRHLQRRRLITTKVHVIAPLYTRLRVEAEVRMLPGFDADEVGRRIHQELENFYHPLTGGEGGKGWPFGRPLYKSEAYQRIDQVEGVDCVERLDLAAGGAGVSRDAQGNVLLPLQGLVFTGGHQIEVLAAAS